MASAKITELNENNTCKICDNALAKYACPKCNIIYCSLTCYQAVGHLECSESFYKESVMSELNLDPNDPESKAKMLEILQRNQLKSEDFNEKCEEWTSDSDIDWDSYEPFSRFVDVEDLQEDLDSDDDIFVEIGTRLKDVNLDDSEAVWEKLNADEKQDFIAFIKSKDISEFMHLWKPWWLHNEDNLVTELNEEGIESFKTECPKIGNIKTFSTLTTKTPAECVQYNLVNLLAAYVFTLRYLNGQHFEFPNEAVAYIAALSLNLKKGQNFDTYQAAVESVEQQSLNDDLGFMTDLENRKLMHQDLWQILKGPNVQEENFYILCALSDFENLLKECLKPKTPQPSGAFSKQFPEFGVEIPHETKEEIKTYLKKTEYFLSFVNDVLSRDTFLIHEIK
ncbi:hypothetical protein ABEB36_006657 [Hypothenemus hampei]|uniref:HIT-type domain-containing protein n=1 Tax=Hypothenemus hampei TaxID=57062 RepID=A0ABD1ERB0_HYPHA